LYKLSVDIADAVQGKGDLRNKVDRIQGKDSIDLFFNPAICGRW
jgi:hypothetical protein